MANGNNGGSYITGFLLGGVVGAIVGILVAPRAGSETRAQLLDQGAALRERAEGMAGPTMETVRESVAPVIDAVAAHVPGCKADAVDGADSAAQAPRSRPQPPKRWIR